MASGSLRCRLAGVDAAVAGIHLYLRRQTVGGRAGGRVGGWGAD